MRRVEPNFVSLRLTFPNEQLKGWFPQSRGLVVLIKGLTEKEDGSMVEK